MNSARASADYYRYRFLMGAMHQNALAMTVRHACIPDDVARVDDIIRAWRGASARMVALGKEEAGVPDRIEVSEPPKSIHARLNQIAEDHLFRASFSNVPTSFKVVDVDYVVAPQREVNLDYVALLRARIPGKSIEQLTEFCVGPRTEPPELKTLQTAQNQVTFSSRSMDLRFLGGFPKPISEEDIAVAHMGGQPVEAISLLVGFGAAPINTWMVGNRVVLNNGFHRVVALRMEGIRQIPVVVQHVANVDIEFPEPLLDLPRAYLLGNPRPVVVKDFFDEQLITELRLKPRRRVVKVTWMKEDSVAPD